LESAAGPTLFCSAIKNAAPHLNAYVAGNPLPPRVIGIWAHARGDPVLRRGENLL